MSTINVRPSQSAAESVGYALYGNDPARKRELMRTGTIQATEFRMKLQEPVQTPEGFIAQAEALDRMHSRKDQPYSYVHAFLPEEKPIEAPGAK